MKELTSIMQHDGKNTQEYVLNEHEDLRYDVIDEFLPVIDQLIKAGLLRMYVTDNFDQGIEDECEEGCESFVLSQQDLAAALAQIPKQTAPIPQSIAIAAPKASVQDAFEKVGK